MNHLNIDVLFLRKKLRLISSKASSKQELKKIIELVGERAKKKKTSTFDLLAVETKVRKFEEAKKGFRNMENFADEMKQLEYIKKL